MTFSPNDFPEGGPLEREDLDLSKFDKKIYTDIGIFGEKESSPGHPVAHTMELLRLHKKLKIAIEALESIAIEHYDLKHIDVEPSDILQKLIISDTTIARKALDKIKELE